MRCRTSNYTVALPRPFPPELMRRYGTHTVSTDRQLGRRPKLLAARKARAFSPRPVVALLMSVFQLTSLQEAFSSGLRRATVLDSALPWMIPEIVHMARMMFVLNTLLPLFFSVSSDVSTSLIHSPTPKFLAFHSSSRPFFFIDQSFLPRHCYFTSTVRAISPVTRK
jgi:hypothetical protein